MYMGGNSGIAATQPWYVVTRLAYGASFTAGLMLIVLLGAELFTGNCIVCTVAWLEGDVAGWRYFLSLVFSWFGERTAGPMRYLFMHKILAFILYVNGL